MNICVAGCRDFTQQQFIEKHLNSIWGGNEFILISGGAKGVDQLAERWAKNLGIKIQRFKADWDRHGKQAGIVRNLEMSKISDLLIAFWDRESSGTGHMVRTMTKLNKPVFIVDITLQ